LNNSIYPQLKSAALLVKIPQHNNTNNYSTKAQNNITHKQSVCPMVALFDVCLAIIAHQQANGFININ
jgi:hypothetical protein